MTPSPAAIHSNDTDQPARGSKRKRVQGACDACRRRKMRCDRGVKADEQCSNCIAFDISCTSSPGSSSAHRASKQTQCLKAQNQSLQNRITELESLLQKCSTGTVESEGHKTDDTTAEEGTVSSLVSAVLDDHSAVFASPNTLSLQRSLVDVARYARRLELRTATSFKPVLPTQESYLRASTPSKSQNCEPGLQEAHVDEKDKHKEAGCNITPLPGRADRCETIPRLPKIRGRSGNARLVADVMNFRRLIHGPSDQCHGPKFRFPNSRAGFWDLDSFAALEDNNPQYAFPEDDLLYFLLDAYFVNIHIFISILHKPTFLAQVANGLHRRNTMFGALLLVVCTLGSAVGPVGLTEGAELLQSRGWKWFKQVLYLRIPLLGKHSLHELQFYCLAAFYIHTSVGGNMVYGLISHALRVAQDLGLHQRVWNKHPTVEEEQWKRAFWVLICTDRIASAYSGRPCGIHDEDCDVDFPIECDDEYWEDPIHPFQQPPGKPSYVTFFNALTKIFMILTDKLQIIYVNSKTKKEADVSHENWEEQVLVQLDSELDRWRDSLPAHLRWDPNMHQDYLSQSGALETCFYFVKMTVHRALTSTGDESNNLPRVEICTDAARKASQIAQVLTDRRCILVPYAQVAIYKAGVMLLFNIWSAIKSERSIDIEKEMTFVQKCMNMLKFCETRWRMAGRFWDNLNELSSGQPSMSQLPTSSFMRNAVEYEERTSSPVFSSSIAAPIFQDLGYLFSTPGLSSGFNQEVYQAAPLQNPFTFEETVNMSMPQEYPTNSQNSVYASITDPAAERGTEFISEDWWNAAYYAGQGPTTYFNG